MFSKVVQRNLPNKHLKNLPNIPLEILPEVPPRRTPAVSWEDFQKFFFRVLKEEFLGKSGSKGFSISSSI